MKSDSNQSFINVVAMLSTFETTFVLHYDNEKDHLLISRPLSRDKLLTAMFFVLSIQLYQRGYLKEIAEDLLAIFQELSIDVESELDTSNSSSTNTSQSSVEENDSNNTQAYNDETERKTSSKPTAESLLEIWKKEPKELIATGRTCFVVKVSLNGEALALKMLNLFKNAQGSLQELEHEKEVVEWISHASNLFEILYS